MPPWSEDVPALTAKLRQQAHAEYKARVPPTQLDQDHRDALIRAINNILSIEIALTTFAQIIDGLPTANVGLDQRLTHLWDDHPVEFHEELCTGALDKAKEVCPRWNLEILAFKPMLLREFNKATPGSKVFTTRLIELVATAMHQFGTILYQLDFRMHKGDVDAAVHAVRPRPFGFTEEEWGKGPPSPPTLFYHPAYKWDEVYPEGKADMVGYWVEDRIFGGVVVFDRRNEHDSEGRVNPNPPNVYLHPAREKVTWRLTQLIDVQQQSLVDFLVKADPDPSSSPLPVIVGLQNRRRVDAEAAITDYGIFRDVWERQPLTKDEYYLWTSRPRSGLDYPEAYALMIQGNIVAGTMSQDLKKRLMNGELDRLLGPDKSRLDLDKLQADEEGSSSKQQSGGGGQ
ncbi:hypothetical protein QBC38DRAFT_88015 [Podospora fimiseda]|uniref:Uncharacterized protein n=1 Tax=Podospora fimiseda TaxID=252190 RepID=A0AAN6YSQ1_9PEZI|nr:hypothetical protein QBC38DRAFT_88015 [Podospora fimiseda]